jgi:deoxyadenosine/deoxycytidine kinase
MGWTNGIDSRRATFETTNGSKFCIEVCSTYDDDTEWYMACKQLGLLYRRISANSLEEAKEEAMDKIVEHLANIIKEMAKS